MENINNKYKKQQIILFSILFSIIIFIALMGIFYFKTQNSDKKNTKTVKKETPQLVGIVNHTFDEKYTSSVLKDNQSLGRELDRKYETLQNQVKKKDEELALLKNKLEEQDNKFKEILDQYNKRLDEVEKKKVGNHYNIDLMDNNPYGNQGAFNQDGYGELANSNPVLTTVSVNRELLEEENELPYIPSGSFAEAIIIEGADANASVTGNNNTDPIQFRLIGKVQMPNDQEYDLTGCFITGEVYGDISSERGKARTHSISCKSDDEDKTIDMKIKGHVSYAGKNGIKGNPVMRNGKIIAWAGAAGVLDGFGKGAESASGKTVGVGATAGVDGGDVLRSALGGGVSTASKTLSDYYIKRAEQYHPIIEISSSNIVTVMFQEGFQLEYRKSKVNNNKDLLQKTDNYSNQNIQSFLPSGRENSFGQIQPSPYEYNHQEQSNLNEEKMDNENNIENEVGNSSADELKNIYLNDYLKGDK
ncbi:TrbI/VirB10 family protein [Gilliamella sp. BG7]|uniref:TrbI/VirB10 family protein n=1 Tax=unclassified Gilliamella TaxID=2685620 RepID=UPI00398836C1